MEIKTGLFQGTSLKHRAQVGVLVWRELRKAAGEVGRLQFSVVALPYLARYDVAGPRPLAS